MIPLTLLLGGRTRPEKETHCPLEGCRFTSHATGATARRRAVKRHLIRAHRYGQPRRQ